MAKQIIAVTGEYAKQDGTQGANFTEIGVVMVSQNGAEYALLDPTINLAGVLLKQNAMAMAKGEQLRDRVMCSVKERQPKQQQGGYGQPAQNQQQRQPQRPAQQQRPAPQPQPNLDQFDDDMPY
jgi:hypothetical protein